MNEAVDKFEGFCLRDPDSPKGLIAKEMGLNLPSTAGSMQAASISKFSWLLSPQLSSHFFSSLSFRANESKWWHHASRPPRPSAHLPWWRVQPVVAVWEDQVLVSLERAHRKSVWLGQKAADLPLLLLPVLVQGKPKHLLGRQGEPVETSCTMEEEGPGFCSVIGWEGTPACRGHRVRLTP